MKKRIKKILSIVLPRMPKFFLVELATQSEKILVREEKYLGMLQKIHWDKEGFSWIKLSNSWRPSAETLEVYANYLKVVPPNSRILILGSTPELRDMVARSHPESQVYICDFSWKMMLLMSTLCVDANPDKEIWVKSNWLEMPFPDQYFDVVMGDMVFVQFSPSDEPALLKVVNRILKQSGLLITRSRLRESGMGRADAMAIVEEVLQKFLGPKADSSLASEQLARRLYGISANPNTRLRDSLWCKNILRGRLTGVVTPASRDILEKTIALINSNEIEKSAVRFLFIDPTDEEVVTLVGVLGSIQKKNIIYIESSAEKYIIVQVKK